MVNIKIKKLHKDAIIPKYQTSGASGFDFHSTQNIILHPGVTLLIKTGLSFEIPNGYELQVRPRSGMSLKTKMRVANSPGSVDSDFRGEVCIIVENIEPYFNGDKQGSYIIINKGDRIAQGVICPVFQATFEEVDELGETDRGTGGFGSTDDNE